MSKFLPSVAGALCLAILSHSALAAVFTLSSKELGAGRFNNTQLLSEPYGFGYTGENKSPSFTWSGAPAGTKSFALQIAIKAECPLCAVSPGIVARIELH